MAGNGRAAYMRAAPLRRGVGQPLHTPHQADELVRLHRLQLGDVAALGNAARLERPGDAWQTPFQPRLDKAVSAENRAIREFYVLVRS